MRPKMMRSMTELAVILLMIAVATGSAWAFPAGNNGAPNGFPAGKSDRGSMRQMAGHRFGPDKEGQNAGKRMGMVMDELGLTAEQKEQMQEFHKQQGEKAKAIMETVRGKQRELRDELEKYDSDMKKVGALVDDLTTAHKQMLEQRVEGVVSMKKVLTKEQFAALNEKMHAEWEKRKEDRDAWRQKMREQFHKDENTSEETKE